MPAEIDKATGKLVPDESYYAAIGQVADAWATLDFRVNLTIWELAHAEQFVGACITAQIIAIGQRTRALAASVNLRGASENLTSDVNRFGATAEGVARERNRVLHDPWSVDHATKEVSQIRITADRKLDFGIKAFSIEELRAISQKIGRVIAEFEKLHERILPELPPFDRTQFSRSQGIALSPIQLQVPRR